MSERSAKLAAELRKIVTGGDIIEDDDARQFFASDVYSTGQAPALVLVPASVDELASAVARITSHGFSVIPRGGGMSYTGGYVPLNSDSVTLDLRNLNRILEINAEDMFITVEPGVTWQQIDEALAKTGLRLPFFGTFSGSRATVGGGMSNGALFLATARHGTAAEIVLGLEVLIANGERLRTGQASFRNGKPFYRTYGPDMTGLFVHDAGALGIKTRISMRLITAPQFFAYGSAVFGEFRDAVAALSALARADVCEELYLFDPETTRNSLSEQGLAKDLKTLAAVVRSENTLAGRLAAGARLVTSGRKLANDNVYSVHYVLAGRSAAAVSADASIASDVIVERGGREIGDSIPRAARAAPFQPLNGILGADGGRWAALNAKIAHSDAYALIEKTNAIFARHSAEMESLGVKFSQLCIAISNHSFSYEPVLRWHDEWLPVHRATPEPAHLKKLTEPAPAPEARRLVDDIRSEIVALFAESGAASNQIGKTYRYFESLEPNTAKLLKALKLELDPENKMNPGALGLN